MLQAEDTEPTLGVNSDLYKNAEAPLKDGILNIYEPSLLKVEKALKELTQNEYKLFEEVHNENLSLSETLHDDDLNAMFNKIELYHNKLTNIRKEMKQLHEKSVKLKKRSLKIKQVRDRDEHMKQQKEVELKQEQDLIGKPNTN